MSDNNTSHLLGTEPIGKLILQYSLPAIIGMIMTSLYNIIDSIFIGHGVGAMAISGLAISFPLMNLLIAFCALVGIGGATISSIRLGQNDIEGATEVLGTVTMLCLINAIIFGSVSYIFLDEILIFFGASEATLPYARDFMQVILIGTPISYIMSGLNNIMRATGHPKKAMMTSLITVLANIIIAPIFIFYFNWGIRGAASATVISQFIGMVWGIMHFVDKKSYVHFTSSFYKMRKRIILSIFSIGMSPFLMNICACFVVIVINNSLHEKGGDLAIGAYGIINRMQILFVMTALGLAMGLQPIIGYNYGAAKLERVKQTLRIGMVYGVAITSFGFLICQIMPHAIVQMFTTDKTLVDISTVGLRIAILAYPLVGCQIVISNFFQSIGRTKVSIFLSLSRQLLFLIPCLLIFPHFWGTNGVWWSMAVSDFLAFVVAVISLMMLYKKIVDYPAESISEVKGVSLK